MRCGCAESFLQGSGTGLRQASGVVLVVVVVVVALPAHLAAAPVLPVQSSGAIR